ncbi:hypothetical protein B0J11DRAFT_199235 [Dendryphion nanum]|uniref:Uncharacterized protein n=1 Tax=Dendryphion nanum TaxID=256645 RepID=A0A9P9D1P2_9PLEO|nr:hypothetical protein B0J11DRAFT_199235 [Dendryphion nanum]
MMLGRMLQQCSALNNRPKSILLNYKVNAILRCCITSPKYTPIIPILNSALILIECLSVNVISQFTKRSCSGQGTIDTQMTTIALRMTIAVFTMMNVTYTILMWEQKTLLLAIGSAGTTDTATFSGRECGTRRPDQPELVCWHRRHVRDDLCQQTCAD